MSNSQLEQVRELLKAKRFDEARALLKAMPDDPTAQKWLTKLNEVYPEQPPAPPAPEPVAPPPPATPEPATPVSVAPAEISPSNVKLDAARQLILEKRYAEARMLLKTVDDPIAWTWLAKLDQIAPEPKAAEPARRRPDKFVLAALGLIAVLVLVIVAVLAGRQSQTPTEGAVLPTVDDSVPTMMVLPTATKSSSPTSQDTNRAVSADPSREQAIDLLVRECLRLPYTDEQNCEDLGTRVFEWQPEETTHCAEEYGDDSEVFNRCLEPILNDLDMATQELVEVCVSMLDPSGYAVIEADTRDFGAAYAYEFESVGAYNACSAWANANILTQAGQCADSIEFIVDSFNMGSSLGVAYFRNEPLASTALVRCVLNTEIPLPILR
ncbi:MAG: hypothetical protein U0452_16420 [Anaerolineae bacterium]